MDIINDWAYRQALSGFCEQHLRHSLSRKSPEFILTQRENPKAQLIGMLNHEIILPSTQVQEGISFALHATDNIQAPLVWLGSLDEIPYFAVHLTAAPINSAPLNLRTQTTQLTPAQISLCALAKVLLHWHAQQGFCTRCGHPTQADHSGYERHCSQINCAKIHYPSMPPAIISLVTYQDQCLLGRQPSWEANHFSNVAGFVDPLESAEMAVIREVYEETGVEIDEVTYQSSQCWPFPGSLMLGFRAKARSPRIQLHDGELAEARWFSRAALKDGIKTGQLRLINPLSISYQLLNDWFCEQSDVALKDLIDS